MSRFRNLALVFAAASLVFTAIALVSCPSLDHWCPPPTIEGAPSSAIKRVTNVTPIFRASFPPARMRACILKMWPWPGWAAANPVMVPAAKHIQAGGGRGRFIVNPGKDPAACFNCHLETHAEFNLPQYHVLLFGDGETTSSFLRSCSSE